MLRHLNFRSFCNSCDNCSRLVKLSMKKKQQKTANTLPYFFGYKTEFFFFQNNPKDLDPSCKMDLDLLDC